MWTICERIAGLGGVTVEELFWLWRLYDIQVKYVSEESD